MNPSVLEILTALGDSGAPAVGEIAKALTTMNQGTDLSALTQGGAFRVENMDPVLASATVKQEHFKFFKRLLPNRRTSWSVLDQAVVKTDIGAFFGSANSDEIGAGQEERQGEYNRLITQLGTYFSRRSVSIVTAIQATMQSKNGVVDFSAVDEEDVNSALEILYSLEHDLFQGDKSKNPLATDGVITAVRAHASGNVEDLWGEPLESHVPLSTLAGKITDMGNWGKPSLVFMSGKVKNDLDAKLEVGYRVNLNAAAGDVQTGVLVKGMKFSSVAAADGMLDFDPTAFLNETKVPVAAKKASLCTGGAPQAVAVAASQNTVAGSKWVDKATGVYQWTVAGNYTYMVEAYSPGKVSLPVAAAAPAALVAGHTLTVTITASAANTETHYKIYRSKKNGSALAADVRLVAVVKKDASGTTTWTDTNAALPGASSAVMLTLDPASLRWIQMLPMTKVPFALNDLSYKWGAFLVGALRVALPQHHGVVDNIIPRTAEWLPF